MTRVLSALTLAAAILALALKPYAQTAAPTTPPKPPPIAIKGANPSGGLGVTGIINWQMESIPAQAIATADGIDPVKSNVVTIQVWRPVATVYISNGKSAWKETLVPLIWAQGVPQ